MSLVDAGIDISAAEAEIAGLKREATRNGTKLLAARRRETRLREKARQETEIAEQVRQLAELFDTEVVKQQEGWTKESSKLAKAANAVGALQAPGIKAPSLASPHDVADNHDLFMQALAILQTLKTRLDVATSEITTAISEASQAIEAVRTLWQTRYKDFQAKLDAELEKVDGQSSLTSLRMHLGSLQERLAEAQAAKEELASEAIPELRALEAAREELIDSLRAARKERREMRRGRVAELNEKTAGFVRIDVPDGATRPAWLACMRTSTKRTCGSSSLTCRWLSGRTS
jgi:hypothetical protein